MSARPLLACLYYAAALALAALVVYNANTAAAHYRALAEELSIEGRQETVVKKLLEGVSLGLYRGAWEREEEVQIRRELIARHRLLARTTRVAIRT